MEKEATTKHTKGAKSIAHNPKSRSPRFSLRLNTTRDSRMSSRKLFPLRMQFFVLSVPFVVASS
jgi:hypothetical protein